MNLMTFHDLGIGNFSQRLFMLRLDSTTQHRKVRLYYIATRLYLTMILPVGRMLNRFGKVSGLLTLPV